MILGKELSAHKLLKSCTDQAKMSHSVTSEPHLTTNISNTYINTPSTTKCENVLIKSDFARGKYFWFSVQQPWSKEAFD